MRAKPASPVEKKETAMMNEINEATDQITNLLTLCNRFKGKQT